MFKNFNVISLNYDQSDEIKEIFKKSVDLGCQAFVISDEIFEIFLEDFHEIHDECIQVFSNKHLVVFSAGNNSFEEISKYSSIDGKSGEIKFQIKMKFSLFFTDLPNTLLIAFDAINFDIKFYTTKFVGLNNESAKIEKLFEIDGKNVEKIENLLDEVNLFPIKVKNLQGREIKLAIFNYMPYTLWKEVLVKNQFRI
jgi:hypothetical protein